MILKTISLKDTIRNSEIELKQLKLLRKEQLKFIKANWNHWMHKSEEDRALMILHLVFGKKLDEQFSIFQNWLRCTVAKNFRTEDTLQFLHLGHVPSGTVIGFVATSNDMSLFNATKQFHKDMWIYDIRREACTASFEEWSSEFIVSHEKLFDKFENWLIRKDSRMTETIIKYQEKAVTGTTYYIYVKYHDIELLQKF